MEINEILSKAREAPSFCADVAKESDAKDVTLSIMRSLGDISLFIDQCFPTSEEERVKICLRFYKTLKHHKIDAAQGCSLLAGAAQTMMMILYKNNLEKEEEVNNG